MLIPLMLAATEGAETLLTENTVIAGIGAAGIVITGFLTYLGVKTKSDRDRVTAMEARLGKTERLNVGLWAYCRALIDHIYKTGGGPPPDPPTNVQELFD